MATFDNVQEKIFDDVVKQAYQAAGRPIWSTFRTRENITGNTVDFRKMSEVVLSTVGESSSLVYQDPGFAKVTATLAKKAGAILIDDVHQLFVDFDAKKECAEALAMAASRQMTQAQLTALTNTATSLTIGSAAMSYDTARTINRMFDTNNVPPVDRFAVISPKAKEQLMDESEFKSADFNNFKPVTNGAMTEFKWMGIHWFVIGTMTEGGLTLSGSDRTCIAWHKNAMGVATGKSVTSKVDWIPEKLSWQIAIWMSLGAIEIDAAGVVKFTVAE